jgi:hypothetical protein
LLATGQNHDAERRTDAVDLVDEQAQGSDLHDMRRRALGFCSTGISASPERSR